MKSKIVLTLLLLLACQVAAVGENNVTAYYFWGDGCPHCAKESSFIEQLQEKYPWFEVKKYETWNNPDNARLFTKAVESLGQSVQGVPTTIIGGEVFVGYDSDETTGRRIEEKILECRENGCIDQLEQVLSCCIHLFVKPGCGQCEGIRSYFSELENKYDIHLIIHDVNDPKEREEYEKYIKAYKVEALGYPTVFIGDSYLVGQQVIRQNMERELKKCIPEGYSCPAEKAGLVCFSKKITGRSPSMPAPKDFIAEEDWLIDLPVFGEIDASKTSLLTIAVIIGIIDGFNPCAMWVLLFLLTLLTYTKSRRKMMIVAGIFLLISGLAYFMFMTAWLNLFLYIGFLPVLRWVVGLGAVVVGLIHLKDFIWFGKGISLSIPDSKKKGIIKSMREIIHTGTWPSIIAGTIILAVTVNFIELVCTAGLPAIFIRILTLNNLPTMTYYFYMGVYILMYMLDDLIIYTIAVYTLSSKKMTEKEGKWLKLISGVLMILLGLTLALKPELLMFG